MATKALTQAQKRAVAALTVTQDKEELDKALASFNEEYLPSDGVLTDLYKAVKSANETGSVTLLALVNALVGEGYKAAKAESLVKEYATLGRAYTLQSPCATYVESLRLAWVEDNLDREFQQFTEGKSKGSLQVRLASLQSAINEQLQSLEDRKASFTGSEAGEKYQAILEQRKNKVTGVMSGFPSIDKVCNGWLPGQIITVGARTGVGKTVFALDSLVNACKTGRKVLFFSLEMNEEELLDRLYANLTGIPMWRLKAPDFPNVERKEGELISLAGETLKAWQMRIDTTPELTVERIKAKYLEHKRDMGSDFDFIIIDYLQLVTPSGRSNNRQEEVQRISRSIKLLAKELNLPIMVLVQVNRQSKDEDENSEPKLYQIRESGSIAQDSNVVLLIHRDTGDGGAGTKDTVITVAKNRNGQANVKAYCKSLLSISHLEEYEPLPAGPVVASNPEEQPLVDAELNQRNETEEGEDDYEELF